jgi:hypothetical protein
VSGDPAPGAPASPERVSWIVALDADPVRRNLLITQTYHELSTRLAPALGPGNANWCTFATWASRTAGRFIREEEVPRLFHRLLEGSEPVRVTLARADEALTRVHEEAALGHDGLLAVVRGVVADVSTLIAAGNLVVFAELAPVFAQTLAVLAASPGPDALDPMAASLKPGLSERGGQSMLASALRHYAAARAEPDQRRRAALMLLANGQVGLHEQIRLQPYIAGSIDAPLRDALYVALDGIGQSLPRRVAHSVHAVASRLFHPVADLVSRLWEEFATRELMTLSLPDGELLLGADLPAPPGAPLYPPVLDPIDGPDTIELLDQYGADRPGRTSPGAVDWATLTDRMRYILDLFRSRQCDAALGGEPFGAEQRDAIVAGLPVPGKL